MHEYLEIRALFGQDWSVRASWAAHPAAGGIGARRMTMTMMTLKMTMMKTATMKGAREFFLGWQCSSKHLDEQLHDRFWRACFKCCQ